MRELIPSNLEVQKRVLVSVPCDDRRFLAKIFSRIPRHIAPSLLAEWEKPLDTQQRYKARVYALHFRNELLPNYSRTRHSRGKTRPSNPDTTASIPRQELVNRIRL